MPPLERGWRDCGSLSIGGGPAGEAGPASWPLPASRWPTALSLPKGVAGQPVAETEQGIRRIGPAPVMGLGLALRLRPCSAAAAVNSRPSSGTPTSRSVTGRRSPRHSLPTASAAASPASSTVIPLSDKPVPSAVRRCRTALLSRSSAWIPAGSTPYPSAVAGRHRLKPSSDTDTDQ